MRVLSHPVHSVSHLLLIGVLAIPLTGCGGGSGGGGAVYTVGGTVSGLSASGLVLQDNGGDDLAVTGSSFAFDTVLADGSRYAVTVLTQPTGQSCSVSNGSGTIAGADVSDVAVTCRGWSTAELLESGTGNAGAQQIAVDGDGNALAVWVQYDGSAYSIYANRYTAGSGWGSAELLESGTGDAATPQIAFDGAGNALAVWSQNDGSVNSIYANRYTAGGGWGSAALIESGAGYAGYPQIAFDGAGNALAVWQQNDGGVLNIYANRYTAGSGWGSAQRIDSGTGNSGFTQIAIDGAGNALAVWAQSDGSATSIYANRYTAGSGWGSAALIGSGTGVAGIPQIAIDGAGNALAVWPQYDGSATNIYANRYTAGAGWGSAALVESGAGDANSPQIAMDSTGNALVVWSQNDGSVDSIYANRYTAGSGWGGAALIESGTGIANHPQIAMDSAGNALAVWRQNDGSAYSIYANRYMAGSGWGSEELLESATGAADAPQIAFDGAGNALTVWEQSDGSYYSIYANRYQ